MGRTQEQRRADTRARLLAAAADLFERQVQILERRGFFADLLRKRRAVDNCRVSSALCRP